MKEQLHIVKITERSLFMRGYEERKQKQEEKENNKKVGFIDKIKALLQ